jgi:xylulokinase
VDVWCEQLTAGADRPGDVHVLCGTTLIVWTLTQDPVSAPGLWTVPHSHSGGHLVGGASNAGGLFLDWVRRLSGGGAGTAEPVAPAEVPVWAPYPRGERTPYHDPTRRAVLDGLDLTHGPAAVRRAGWEASGFVVRHLVERSGVAATRVVATGGGTRVDGWMQALADATGLPVHAAAIPEGAALGAAFMARVGAGVEPDVAGAARWARTGRVVDPDPAWTGPVAERYQRFRRLSDPATAAMDPLP